MASDNEFWYEKKSEMSSDNEYKPAQNPEMIYDYVEMTRDNEEMTGATLKWPLTMPLWQFTMLK